MNAAGASRVAFIRCFAAAVATLVLVGVGLGWVLSGGSGPATVALSPEQQEWQSSLLANIWVDMGAIVVVALVILAIWWRKTSPKR